MRIIEISINTNLYPFKSLKKGHHHFRFCGMFPPGPSFSLTYVVSIYRISIQYKGFAGSRGGTYFKIKNGDDPICVMLNVCIKTFFFDAHVQ